MNNVVCRSLVIIGMLGTVLTAEIALPKSLESESFDSNGTNIHFIVQGEGSPVVLIHDFASDIQSQWIKTGILDELSRNAMVIAFDCRGHGKSDKRHEPQDYGLEVIEDVVRLLDHLGLKKAHLIGYGMGGMVVVKMLESHPDRVCSAIPCATGWFKQGSTFALFLDSLAGSLADNRGFLPLAVVNAPANAPLPAPEKVAEMDASLLGNNDAGALSIFAKEAKQLFVSQEVLEKNTIPTLVIVGALDKVKVGSSALAGVTANSGIQILPFVDHLSLLSDPLFLVQIREFILAH